MCFIPPEGNPDGALQGVALAADMVDHHIAEFLGQRYSLNAPSIVLGRSSEADILVDDTGVSRRHLEIQTAGGTTTAVDLGSTNGSYVNGHKVAGSMELTDGSTITMGRTKIIFRLLPANTGGRP